MQYSSAAGLTGSQQAVQEFGLIGAGQWLRYLAGTAELAGAIGLLTSWLSGLAADMAGASIINATVLHSTTFGINIWMTHVLADGSPWPALADGAAGYPNT